jgi:DNA primase
MRYPPHLLDDIRARLPVSQVVGRKVALKKAGREYRGLSPFKVEKTPSFFVNDQKGFYHCFATGEHGDIFTFLMKTEGLSFPEAVERLAEDAGVPLPKPDVREAQREDQRTRLYNLLETAAEFFTAQLASAGGAEARRYLRDKRGLQPATVAGFRLGYAPAGRHVLKDHLAAKGFALDDMISSGMLIGGDDIPVAYDRFRNRVMFPITDLRGRVIAFGGRALDPDAPAKYLNSPETPLFHKGANLYNAARARPLAHERGRIVVVEGYMDVVAMTEAGLGETVAPLGTALTEDQVKLLWRFVPEPTLCFDGDSAGQKAAYRAVETVLPHLKPGHSLRFAFLPDGLDPDDLLRQSGPDALRAAIERTRPLVDVMFERAVAGGDWSTPERRAALAARLGDEVRRIGDETVRHLYQAEIRSRLQALWQPVQTSTPAGQRGGPERARRAPWTGGRGFGAGSARGGLGGRVDPAFARPVAGTSLKQSRLVAGGSGTGSAREALILKTLINHPWLIAEHAERIAELEFSTPAWTRLRDALLALLAGDEDVEADLLPRLEAHGAGPSIATLDRVLSHGADRFALPGATPDEVSRGFLHSVGLQERHVSLQRAIAKAQADYDRSLSEDALEQIIELNQQLARLTSTEAEDVFG